MVCPRCARENEEGNRFCGRCGLDFSKFTPSDPAPAGDAMYCYRHKKEPTHLTCGRCGKPICHRCVITGPAGVRCRECGRLKTPIRPRAIVGEAKLGFRRMLRMGPYGIYIYLLIAVMLFGMLRGCASRPEPPEREAPRQESRDDRS